MSTKMQLRPIDRKSNSSTYQARSVLDETYKLLASAMANADPLTTSAWAVSTNLSRYSLSVQCTKSAEAERQVQRIRNLLDLNIEDEQKREKLIESIGTSVALLHSFISSPAPIPVASDGENEGTSLFIESDGFYGDIEISGKTIEYYIISGKDGDKFESYDVEQVENGTIPSRLLGCLYSHYAR